MAKTKFDPRPDWLSTAQKQATASRYNAGDERGARFVSLSPKGPMVRLAVAHAVKAWACNGNRMEGNFASSADVLKMLQEGRFEHCEAAPDQWWSDPLAGKQSVGVWLLTEPDAKRYVILLAPRYADLRAARAEELSKKSLAAGIRDPKTPYRINTI